MIIGHGPSAVGRGWGRRIDNHECVVRMRGWEWQNRNDYGVRYDIGVIYSTDRPKPGERHPSRCWWIYDHKKFVRNPITRLNGVRAKKIDHAGLHERAREMGGRGVVEDGKFKLSRGCMAVCHAIRSGYRRIVLVGFDDTRLGACVGEQYSKTAIGYFAALYGVSAAQVSPPIEPGKERWRGAHDTLIEQMIINEKASEHAAVVEHAQDDWQWQ